MPSAVKCGVEMRFEGQVRSGNEVRMSSAVKCGVEMRLFLFLF